MKTQMGKGILKEKEGIEPEWKRKLGEIEDDEKDGKKGVCMEMCRRRMRLWLWCK